MVVAVSCLSLVGERGVGRKERRGEREKGGSGGGGWASSPFMHAGFSSPFAHAGPLSPFAHAGVGPSSVCRPS